MDEYVPAAPSSSVVLTGALPQNTYYIRGATKTLLNEIKGEVQQIIKDTLAKKGLDEDGKAISKPDLDENGNPIVIGAGGTQLIPGYSVASPLPLSV